MRCIKPNAAKLPGRMENAKVRTCANAIGLASIFPPPRLHYSYVGERFSLKGRDISTGLLEPFSFPLSSAVSKYYGEASLEFLG